MKRPITTITDPVMGEFRHEWFGSNPPFVWEGLFDFGELGGVQWMFVHTGREGITQQQRETYQHFVQHLPEYFLKAYQKIAEGVSEHPEEFNLASVGLEEIQELFSQGKLTEVLSRPELIIHQELNGKCSLGLGFQQSMLDEEHGTGVRFLNGIPVDVVDRIELEFPVEE